MSRAGKILENIEHIDSYGRGVDVHVDPRNLPPDDYRFCVVKNGYQTFFWDAYQGTHSSVLPTLGLAPDDVFCGRYWKRDNELEFVDSYGQDSLIVPPPVVARKVKRVLGVL